MDHRDALVAEVVVVLTAAYEDRMTEAVELLKAAGLDASDTIDDDGIVEGTIDTTRLGAMQQLPCVSNVRTVSTYVADYARGEPRDQDLAADEDALEAD